MDLTAIRNEIDSVDDQLWRLIIKRIELSREVAKCKLAQNRPVFNPEREIKIVKRLQTLVPKFYQDSLSHIYLQILRESKAIQQKLIAEWTEGKKEK